MNSFIKYLYIPIIITLIAVLFILFANLAKLMKKVAITNDSANILRENINEVKEKTKQIEQTRDSWRFFISIFIVFTIIKETIIDYKNTSKLKRTFSKSFTKTCVRNVSKIKKISI